MKVIHFLLDRFRVLYIRKNARIESNLNLEMVKDWFKSILERIFILNFKFLILVKKGFEAGLSIAISCCFTDHTTTFEWKKINNQKV
ncbi:hypothetical protein BpHYR1_050280 [Brachionus plicatilis]|uniref:Uncharacterized protein n=1 Tax=Brachionus plicatilis TaxID=10195 RepID=A0A3M7QR21_BRAPC|nr:hypothetical protein BpHYR1_050280 [Brachionus plicatilis]